MVSYLKQTRRLKSAILRPFSECASAPRHRVRLLQELWPLDEERRRARHLPRAVGARLRQVRRHGTHCAHARTLPEHSRGAKEGRWYGRAFPKLYFYDGFYSSCADSMNSLL